MTPTINVNLKPCECGGPHSVRGLKPHLPSCPADSILIPCHIPRSVEMTVMLDGPKCDCGGYDSAHSTLCPRYGRDRPIHVTCSVGGDGTWDGSFLESAEVARDDYRVSPAQWAACRERWEIVKALVTGRGWTHLPGDALPLALFQQRDAVFAALTKMAKAEEAVREAQQDFYTACPIFPPSEGRPSTDRLAAYVSHLIAMVGAM